ncbi:hypothetical protein JCM19376_38870 [Fusibacter bizertensis]
MRIITKYRIDLIIAISMLLCLAEHQRYGKAGLLAYATNAFFHLPNETLISDFLDDSV